MNLEENLNKILSRHDELQKKATSDEVINSPKDYAVISKELSEIFYQKYYLKFLLLIMH